MKLQENNIEERINQILIDNSNMLPNNQDVSYDAVLVEKTIFGSISILNMFYGENSSQVKSLLELRGNYVKGPNAWKYSIAFEIQSLVNGLLNTLKSDIKFNLIGSIKSQIAGEIYGDFISLAKSLVGDGYKDSAAVLACGALEDSMKKFATKNYIEAYDMDLSAVVNSLKSKGLLKGTQAGVVQSYVKLRNKTFHAQFDKIELPEVVSLISFIEIFVMENF